MGATLLGITFQCSATETYNQDKYRIDAEHTAIYKIQCDDITDREDVVITADGCPYVGMDSAIIPGAKCTERNITEVGAGVWDVEARFSYNYIKEPEEGDPWDATPTWNWSTETSEEPLLEDAQTGNAIVNSAKQSFRSPPAHPIAIPVLTIERYELTFNGQTILDYTNHVNSATFWGATAGKVLCAGISAQQETLGDNKVWKVTYVFKFKCDTYGWKLRLMDEGSYYWEGDVGDSEKKPIKDDNMNNLVGLLDGHGHKLDMTTEYTPVFLTYNRYDNVNFNLLNLGPWS